MMSSNFNSIFIISDPLNRMEVAVHTNSEQYSESQTGKYGLQASKDGKLCDKPQELGVANDVESAVEKVRAEV